MRQLDQMGVAALAVVITVVLSTGAALAAPVAASAADVPPDSPFYALKRVGEHIRMFNDTAQMKARFNDFSRMCAKGKGSQYLPIMQEFKDKMKKVLGTTPDNTEAKAEIIAWMQRNMPGVGMVRLELLKEAANKLKENLKGRPEVSALENSLAQLKECKSELMKSPENLAKVEARLALIRERIKSAISGIETEVGKRVLAALSTAANVGENIEVTIQAENFVWGKIINLENIYQNQLERFENLYAEVQAMLAGAPGGTHGKRVVEKSVVAATSFKIKAIAAHEENNIRTALGLVHAANRLLHNAKTILEHADKWEPEHAIWKQWKRNWENMKTEWKEKGEWENLLSNWQQHSENVKHRWNKRWVKIVTKENKISEENENLLGWGKQWTEIVTKENEIGEENENEETVTKENEINEENENEETTEEGIAIVTVGSLVANPAQYVDKMVTTRGQILVNQTGLIAPPSNRGTFYLVSNGASIGVAGDVKAYVGAQVEVTGELEIEVGISGPKLLLKVEHIVKVGAG